MTRKPRFNTKKLEHRTTQSGRWTIATLATLGGITCLTTGCNNLSLEGVVNAQSLSLPTPTSTPWSSPSPIPPTNTPTQTPAPTNTPWLTPTSWPTPTMWPTATPWPTLQAWAPEPISLPTVAPVPVVPTAVLAVASGSIPVGYSPPDGVDVFGNTILRWSYYGALAEDEWFDIKIKPLGSENSAFVDWTKEAEYELRPWYGWISGLYTWQIGIVKGQKEGESKHFVADLKRDSEKFIIKWQALGGGHNGGGSNGGGGGASGGS